MERNIKAFRKLWRYSNSYGYYRIASAFPTPGNIFIEAIYADPTSSSKWNTSPVSCMALLETLDSCFSDKELADLPAEVVEEKCVIDTKIVYLHPDEDPWWNSDALLYDHEYFMMVRYNRNYEGLNKLANEHLDRMSRIKTV